MRHFLTGWLCTFPIFLVGIFIINGQLSYSAREAAMAATKLAVSRVDRILDEARQAAVNVSYLGKETCSSDARFLLNNEIAQYPHLRTISLLKGNIIWCSSLSGNERRSIRQEIQVDSKLKLYQGEPSAPDVPFLVYIMTMSAESVAVGISDFHLRDALETTMQETELTLVVGNSELPREGRIRNVSTESRSAFQIQSAQYPFRIRCTFPVFFSFYRLIHQGALLIIMNLAMAIFAGIFLRRYAGKYATPEENLRKALERGDIIPYYQPVIDGKTGQMLGLEVLARWKVPGAGFIPPDLFIPVAEKSGQIIELTRMLLKKTLTEIKPVVTLLPEGLHIGINVSAIHLSHSAFCKDIMFFLRSFPADKVTLVLEITEREPLILTPDVRKRLEYLRLQGILIALDDFGTGYSSLSCLNEFPVDIIKIDKSFVGRINGEAESTRLVDCVIDMARKFSLRIVAEGVETTLQEKYLSDRGIDMLQGYYYSRPIPGEDVIRLLIDGKTYFRKEMAER